MGVVELDRDLLRQLVPIRIVAQETARQVGHGACDQEIFLQEAQSLPRRRGIVRIQYAGQRLRFERLAQSTYEIAGAKFLKIKIIRRSRSPEAECVDRLSAIADHRTV